MNRPSRIAKRLLLPVLLAATLVVVQVVLAQPPVASFTVSPQGAGGCGTFTFTSTSTDADIPPDITATEWDLDGDGNLDAGVSGSPVVHTYATPGARSVTMRVTDAAGGDDDSVDMDTAPAQTVNVVNANAPTAAIAPPPAAQAGVPVHLTGSGTDPGGAVASYAWELDGDNDFNDATTAEVDHTFATTGPKPIAFRVTDNCGDSTDATAQVEVGNSAPTGASFTMTAAGAPVGVVNPGTLVTFHGTATDANGDILVYHWDLDGDGIYDEVAENETNAAEPTHTYPAFPNVKTVTVRLRVTDGAEGEAVAPTQQLVINKAPFGAFTISPEAPTINEPVAFDATQGSFDFENSITTYEWDFDYGGTPSSFAPDATGATTGHTFTSSGAKSVALRVTDEDLGVTVAPRTVSVSVTRPKADLTFSPENPLPGQPVTLSSTSTPSVSAPALEATQWDFDYSPLADFTIDAAGGSIVTSFATAGPHTVAVKVTETGGGSDIKSLTINVNAPPQASFTVAPAKPIEGREVTFASTSNDPDGPLVKQEWDLDGNGTYERAGAVASTSSLKKGTRTVRLRVTDSKGATATGAVPVKVGARVLKNPPDVQSTISGGRTDWGIILASLTVRVPSKTSVAVTCKGRGCPRGTFRKRSKKKAALLTFSKVKGRLRAGAKISIIFTRPGHITGWDMITVRGNRRPTLLREGCKPSGAKKQKRCP